MDKNLVEKQLVSLITTRLIVIKEEIISISGDIKFYEKKYQMISSEFMQKYNEGKLSDDEDYFVWKGSIHILENLDREQNLLRG